MCILRPDPLNDPDVRRFYKQIIPPKSKNNVSGTSKEDKHRARVYLQTRAGDYNQANNFLAEVLRTTISRQCGIFYTLYSRLVKNDWDLQHDAHTLFYCLKRSMKTMQGTLLDPVIKRMHALEMKVERGIPLARNYVYELYALAQTVVDLTGTCEKDELLKLFQAQCLKVMDSDPVIANNGHIIMMLKSPEYDMWDKIVHVHDAITQMVVIEANKKAYDQHLADFSASLTALPANKPPTAAVANAIVKAPSTSTSTSTKQAYELSIGLDERCVVHPKGKHTNKQCDKQTAVRAKNVPLNQLIKTLLGVISQNEANQAKWQADKKASGKDSSKQKPDKRRDDFMKSTKGSSLSTGSFDISATVTPSKPKSKKRSPDDSSTAESQGSKDSSKKAKVHVANVLINVNGTDNQKMGKERITEETVLPEKKRQIGKQLSSDSVFDVMDIDETPKNQKSSKPPLQPKAPPQETPEDINLILDLKLKKMLGVISKN
jgi:hypothetical protein